MQNKYHDISLMGACHVFANTVAKKLNTNIWMVVHQNPEWDNDNISYQEFIDSQESNEYSIIHAFAELNNHQLFDTTGIIKYNNKPIMTTDPDLDEKLIGSIINSINHGSATQDPLLVFKFSQPEFEEILETETNSFKMYDPQKLFTQHEMSKYKSWVLKKLKKIA